MRSNYLGVLAFCALLLCSCAEKKYEIPAEPVKVIFDTDIGNDIDDVLALQMLVNYHKRGKISLDAVTISKCNKKSVMFADGYLRFNNLVTDLGFSHSGVTPDDYFYLVPTLMAEYHGRSIIEPKVDTSSVEEAYVLMRKKLVEALDSSVVIIVVGPMTNMGRLLESKPDSISSLDGVSLVRQKVREVVLMAGMFEKEGMFPEYNVVCDIPAAQSFFDKCPVPMIVSGFEIGARVLYPHESVLADFGVPEAHPLPVSYIHYSQMPYDRQTWDLTAVYQAVEPDNNLIEYSQTGKIHIDDEGYSIFEPLEGGTHQILLLDDKKVNSLRDTLVTRVVGRF